MSEYTLTIKVEDLGPVLGNSLCLVKAMQSPDAKAEIYNVVFQTAAPNKNITFKWTDHYFMCGSNAKLVDGGSITASTDWRPVNFQQIFTVKENFNVQVALNRKITDGSYQFRTEAFGMSCVIGLGSAENPKPFFQSPTPLLKDTTGTYTPRPRYKVFWSRDYKSSSMIASELGDAFDIDFTGTTTHQVTFKSDQTWYLH
ncbi:hypothetical protein ABW21_db0204570 [Orbilia brochopaga]|nr:hypothetical protein ABW21_db0204570 [Drechslerella brochopaga]